MTEISALKAGLIADIDAADTLEALEALRVGALGKSGVVTGLLKTRSEEHTSELQSH